MGILGLAWVMGGEVSAGELKVQLQSTRGPHYVGDPIPVQVRVTGTEEEPAPECTFDLPAGGTLTPTGQGIVEQSIQIFNGRKSARITHGFNYRFVADKPGTYTIGPFRVTQGSSGAKSNTLSLTLTEIPLSDLMRLRVVLPEKPVYPGQRVPVTVEWWLDAEKARDILDSGSRFFSIPLFDLGSAFSFIDESVERGENMLEFQTAGGDVTLPVTMREERSDDRDFIVIQATRTAIPTKPGEYDLPSASVTADEVVRWEREFFGRRPARVRKIRTIDLPRRVVVAALPSSVQPKSFAGAVGRGFTLEVAVDRSVVKAGDPVTLTLTLRGEGMLETAGLAPLADCGLPAEEFRAPRDTAAGELRDDGSKVFQITVRVLREGTREIPPLSYSWFDSDAGEYRTTQSRPIALSVKAGELVTASEVLGKGAEQQPVVPGAVAGSDSGTSGTPTPAGGGGRPLFTLTGADLSNTIGAAVLIDERSRFGGRSVRYTLVGAPVLALLVAFGIRRRRDVDPKLLERRRVARETAASIARCAGRPRRAAAGELVTALRTLVASFPEARTAEVDRLIAECEVIIYAPSASDDPPIDAALVRRAGDIASGMRERAG